MKNCSFCQELGHTIVNCADPAIDLLIQEFHEYVAFDFKCKFKSRYIQYGCSLFSLPELRMIGYYYNMNMNKLTRDDFTSEIINASSQVTTMYDEIISKMNMSELVYFSKKIANSSNKWNSRKYSFVDIKKRLGIHSNVNDSFTNDNLKNTDEETDISDDETYAMSVLCSNTIEMDEVDNVIENVFTPLLYIFIFGIAVYMSQ